MKRTDVWRMTAIAGLILLLGLSPFQAVSGQASYSDIAAITVDQHWVDITQLDDPDAFKVDEYIFINNSGSASFGGSIQVWLPENSQISADCCGGVPDMACRNHEGGKMECFYFISMDGNRYVGYPFENSPNLTYYGQEAEMSLSIRSQTNATIEDSINMTAIIGSPPIARTSARNVTGGVGIDTKNEVLGLKAALDLYMPYNLTAHENITITNNGSVEDTFSLDISGLPDGWKASFWNETGIIKNITLGANETKEIFVIITAPSYMASIYVGYTVELSDTDEDYRGIFEKQYIYDHKETEVYLFLLKEDGLLSTTMNQVHPSPGDTAPWNEENSRFWYVLEDIDIDKNSTSMIDVDLQSAIPPQNSADSWPLLLFIIVIIIVLIAAIALRRTSGHEADVDDELDDTDDDELDDAEADTPVSRDELLEKKAMNQKLIERVANDHKAGLLTSEAAMEMKDSYEAEISRIDKELQKPDAGRDHVDEKTFNELQSKKKSILQSIKRIERELEDGLIGEDDFYKFNEAYRSKAKEIIQQIDEMS